MAGLVALEELFELLILQREQTLDQSYFLLCVHLQCLYLGVVVDIGQLEF